MKYLIFFLLLSAHLAYPQSFTEKVLETSIEEVTIYLQGAQILRKGQAELPQGKSIFRVKGLSPYIDEKSVQVTATGSFTILSVNHKHSYLNRLQKDERIDSLKSVIKSLEFEISSSEARLEVLQEKQSLLNANKNLGGETSGASLSQIKQAIDFYDQELSSIKSEELKTRLKIQELQENKKRMEREIAEVNTKEDLPTGEIEIRVEAAQKTKGTFTITYLVANAGWYPKYDVRVENISQPLTLKYKADVYQNTGIIWENVKLRLSNGNPNQSGVAPEMQTWHLNFARNTIYNRGGYSLNPNNIRNVSGKILDENGSPLPGVNVVVKGTTVGVVTDTNGQYSLTLPNGATHLVISSIGYIIQEVPITSSNISTQMEPDIQQLSEVVSVGYGLQGKAPGVRIRGNRSVAEEAEPITTTTIENQTTVEFEVDEPYSVMSNGEQLTVDVKNFNIDAMYEYYAVPKLDKDAFLIAKIVNWNQYNLLEGEANLYFEDAYVGRSVLDARSLADTLSISLGRDKSIVIGREKIDEFSKRRTIGSNKIENREFKIIARNNKLQPIRLTLQDQVPVSVINDITVTATELSGGMLKEKTGKVIWELELEPRQQTELKLGYEVKYPKNEQVNLE